MGTKPQMAMFPKKDHTGLDNPHYELFTDYYGDVYARYVGPYTGYVAWSIWVPKTLHYEKSYLPGRTKNIS